MSRKCGRGWKCGDLKRGYDKNPVRLPDLAALVPMIRQKARDSFQYWEDDTFVQETLRNHKGHELTVVERIGIDGKRLIYKHEITG